MAADHFARKKSVEHHTILAPHLQFEIGEASIQSQFVGYCGLLLGMREEPKLGRGPPDDFVAREAERREEDIVDIGDFPIGQ